VTLAIDGPVFRVNPLGLGVDREITVMNSKTKFWVRVVVLAALLAWPAVETWRLLDTRQKLEKAKALQQTVQTQYEAARARHVQVAGAPDTASTPPSK
jgi:hypothetical protein